MRNTHSHSPGQQFLPVIRIQFGVVAIGLNKLDISLLTLRFKAAKGEGFQDRQEG